MTNSPIRPLVLSITLLFSTEAFAAGIALCYDSPFSYTGTIVSNNRNCVWNGGTLALNAGVTITNRGNGFSPFTLQSSVDGVFTNSGLITYGSNNNNAKPTMFVSYLSSGLNAINNAGTVDSGPTYIQGSAAISIESGAVWGGVATSYATYTGTYYSGNISSAIYNQAGAYIGQDSSGSNISDYGILNAGTINGGSAAGNSGSIFNAGTINGVAAAIMNTYSYSINNSTQGNFFSAIANFGVLSGGIFNGGGNIGTNAPGSTTYAITNYGSITAPSLSSLANNGWAIYNTGNIGSDSSPGVTKSVQNSQPSASIAGIFNDVGAYMGQIANSGGSISSTITNNGRINGISNSYGGGYGTIDSIINQSGASITGQTGASSYSYAINNVQAHITTGITNQANASIVGGISVTGFGSNVASITNAGTICSVTGGNTCSGPTSGIALNVGPTVSGSTPTTGTVTNTGSIIGGISNGDYGIANAGIITELNNTGTITGSYGIYNNQIITTLNNAQSNLTYKGILPVNYNIIINSTSDFGKLAVTSGTGSTAFGIKASSVVNNNHTYSSVLSGITASQVTNTSGTYGGYSWLLSLQSGSSTIWDLLFGSLGSPGPSVVDTQASLRTSALKLRNIFNVATISTDFANMNTYDCNLFDTKGMCISVGGRYTTVDNPDSNRTSAVVVVGYKATPNIRIGGFLDQSVNNNTPSGIKVSNKDPLMGAFVVWNQNTDGLGYQVKLANAYQDKDVDITREVIGTSEAGRGDTNLNTQSYVGELSYAFNYNNKTLLRPYLALRHTTIKQDAYTETGVTTPLSYASLEDRSTTALLGLKLNHQLTPKTTLTASLGIEQDLEHSVDDYSATSTGISGLTAENFNDSIKRTRPVASAGAYYALSKTQRIAGDIYYQQLPFQASGSTTAYFNYMIGF